ncbi:MAG: DMT family transporter [Bacteroidota bacterium]
MSSPKPAPKTIGFLILAVLLLSLSGPAIKWLTANAPLVGIKQVSAISYCNTLFIGNFAAGMLVLIYFRPFVIFRDWRAVSRQGKGYLFVASILAIAYPAMIFTALATTTVTNVVLVSRFEGLFVLLASHFIAKEKVARNQWIGNSIIAAGVAVVVLQQGMGIISVGDLYVLGAGVVHAAAVLHSKRTLAACTLPLFVFFRNAVSAVFFFVFAIVLYGPTHFMDAFLPELWLVMSGYALIVIVAGQFFWYYSLNRVPTEWVANVGLAMPAITLVYAAVLLQESPTAVQWISIGIIVVGLIIAKLPGKRKPKEATADLAPELDKTLIGT